MAMNAERAETIAKGADTKVWASTIPTGVSTRLPWKISPGIV